MYDIIIIGGGCAGLTAAVYSARAGKSVLVIEGETFGGQITAAPKIENYPAIGSISGMEFADSLFSQAEHAGAQFEFSTVTEITDGEIKIVKTEDGEFSARSVIIASGSKHRKLEIEGEERFAGHGVSYCAVCDGAFFKGKTAVVAGGGNTAFSDALYLSAICEKVYLIHRRSTFRADNVLIERARNCNNIEIITDTVIKQLIGNDSLTGIITESNSMQSEIKTDALFAAIGRIPENEIFKNIVELDSDGYIIAGEDCRTSAKGIFAAGDCRRKSVRQLTTAAADGACAASAACAEV